MSLQYATALGELSLSGTSWDGRADFRKTEIEHLVLNSDSRPSRVRGVFDARQAKIGKAAINDVLFFDLVDFSDAEFGRSVKNTSTDNGPKENPCNHPTDERAMDQRTNESRTDETRIDETEEVKFEYVTFAREVDFLRAKFWSDAIFVRNRFRDVWDLTGTTFEKREGEPENEDKPRLCFSFNTFGKLVMEREHLGYESWWFKHLILPPSLQKSQIRGVNFEGDEEISCLDLTQSGEANPSGKNEQLPEIYNAIASSFRQANDRLGENEAWYLGMVAGARSQDSNVGRWISRIFLDIPSRFGIDLYRVCLVSVILMLLFAIAYWSYFYRQIELKKTKLLVWPKSVPDQNRAFRFRPFESFFKSGAKTNRPLQPVKDALFLSGRTFLKLGAGTTYPRERMLVWIAYLEWAVGTFMLIHLLVALKNTLPIALLFFGT